MEMSGRHTGWYKRMVKRAESESGMIQTDMLNRKSKIVYSTSSAN